MKLYAAHVLMMVAALRSVSAESAVTIRVFDGDSTVPCRIHLYDQENKPQRVPGLPYWFDHFVCSGTVKLKLALGKYHYVIERGPEWNAGKGEFAVAVGQELLVNEKLTRIVDMKSEGWWSGETHVHRGLHEIELLMRAEDLHVAALNTWWNNRNQWLSAPLPDEPVREFDGCRFYQLMGGEDERNGGALMLLNLSRAMKIAGAGREYPPSTKFLMEAKRAGAWVDIEKPFWWDVPIWLATARTDSMGIVHNHYYRVGVMDDEAWGRKRDREKFPGLHGNGLYTQSIYFEALNCGLRIPPSAGSASGVLPNPVGYNRVYVYVNGPLTYERWWEELKAGHAFVTNGPLLRVKANGVWPGNVFNGRGSVTLEGKLDSRDPIKSVELIINGKAERITLPHTFTPTESGWFLVRATCDVEHTLRNALTAPWYFELDGKAMKPKRESAQMFLDWTRKRGGQIEGALSDKGEREEALKPAREAEGFWRKMVESSELRP